MKNRKILCAFLMALLCVTAVSCQKSEENNKSISTKNNDSSSESESSTVEEKETVNETEQESKTEKRKSEEKVSAYGTMRDFSEYVTATEVNPPMWKVTDPETNNQLYVMGTVHVLPESFTDFPDYVMDVYENSDGIAVEYDVTQIQSDIRALSAYQKMFMYDDGTTIKDHISEDTYNKVKAYFETIGAYSEPLNQFSAGYWYNQLSSIMLLRLENLSLTGVDSTFIENAKNDGKEVVNIETLDIQVGAIDGYSDELVDYLLSEAIEEIDNIDEYAESLGELYDCWAKGEVDPMLDEETEEIEELPEDLKDDYEDYMDIMLYNRNKGMAEKASEFLKEGKNYMFMVGSAHYAGDKGVDDLLTEMGYTVEKVS